MDDGNDKTILMHKKLKQTAAATVRQTFIVTDYYKGHACHAL